MLFQRKALLAEFGKFQENLYEGMQPFVSLHSSIEEFSKDFKKDTSSELLWTAVYRSLFFIRTMMKKKNTIHMHIMKAQQKNAKMK